jgi:hypothetical protein
MVYFKFRLKTKKEEITTNKFTGYIYQISYDMYSVEITKEEYDEILNLRQKK